MSVTVLAAIDGYRLTGPGKQVLASQGPGLGARVRLAVFLRSASPTPFILAAQRTTPVLSIRDRFPGDPRTVTQLLRHAGAADVDIVQTHGYKPNVLMSLIAPRLKRPWIAFLHGETYENAKIRLYYRLERLAVRRASRVVVVSHAMAARAKLMGIPPTKLHVIHNACLVEPASATDGAIPARDSAAVVGIVGRLSPEKGVDVGLEIHGAVRRRVPGASLVIAGEGPERSRLEVQARRLGVDDSVTWLGYREEVDGVYRSMSVLLMPSRSEGLPNVALEAFAHGVPVVASAVGGLPEIVSHGRNGYLVTPGDTASMVDHVVSLLGDRALRMRLGANAREDVERTFSLPARRAALSALYDEVAA
jgi:glycosyltransferase involved in cell wall biosynthesis